jgi:hypothetical protein
VPYGVLRKRDGREVRDEEIKGEINQNQGEKQPHYIVFPGTVVSARNEYQK